VPLRFVGFVSLYGVDGLDRMVGRLQDSSVLVSASPLLGATLSRVVATPISTDTPQSSAPQLRVLLVSPLKLPTEDEHRCTMHLGEAVAEINLSLMACSPPGSGVTHTSPGTAASQPSPNSSAAPLRLHSLFAFADCLLGDEFMELLSLPTDAMQRCRWA
jgi:hypothetical protein